MKEVVVTEHGGPEVLQFRESEPPEPGPGEVLLDVEAIGVNWTEMDQRQGNYHNSPDPPFTPGCEAAGVVAETGPGVEDWSVGDEVVAVVGYGAYAEQTTVSAHRLLPRPESVTMTEAGGLMVQAFTSHNLAHEWGEIAADETALVHAAAGGIGSKIVQLADMAGATIIGTASSERKLAFAEDSGADHTVNYETEDVADAVADLTDGGVDVVFDGVGGRAFYQSFDCLAPGGRIVVYGAASGSVPTVATPRIYHNNVTLVGYDMQAALDHEIERVHAAKDHLYECLADGSFDLQITDVRPLSEVVDVHREMEARETTGKLVLLPE